MYVNNILKISLTFFLITSGLYILFVLLSSVEYYNYCSTTALLFGIALTSAIYQIFDNKEYIEKAESELLTYQESIRLIPILTVLGNGLLGFLGLYLLYQKVDFKESPELKNVLIISGGFGILVAQIGGWILQSFLINLLSVFFGSRNGPKIYFNIVGISYVGFLFITVASIIFNLYFLPDKIYASELNEIIFNSYWHVISGKVGEFIVLSFILYYILHIERVSVLKASIISVAPSVLLLFFNLLFQKTIL